MPAFLAPLIAAAMAAFSRLVSTRAGMWVATALGALGLSLATHEIAMGPIMNMVRSSASGIPADLAQWLGVLQVDRYITIVLSAFTAGAVKRAFLARKAAQ